MLINCTECKNEISNKAKKCPQCGAPVPDWVDRLSVKSQSIIGLLVIGVFLFGLIWYFFLRSEIEISDKKIHYGLISDRYITFTAKNSGPKETYKYHVLIGDEFWNRIFSQKYCEGTFVMKRDEERQMKIKCPDLNFTFTNYSFAVK